MSIKNSAIRALKPRDKPYRVAVGDSLFLLVTPSGSKLWQYRYRFEGRANVLSFGPYPLVTLLHARMQRDAARTQLIQGINPAKKKESAIRFSSIVEQWFKANTVDVAKPWAKATARKVRIYLDRDVLPTLGKRPVANIQRADLIKLIESMEARGAFDPANKMRHWLVGIFDLAVQREIIKENPALGLRRGITARGVINGHNPFVFLAELPALLAAIESVNTSPANVLAIKLILLTACRPGELRLAHWDEFDLLNAIWTIPATRTKMRREHVVPLSQQALSVANQLKAIAGSGQLVLPNRAGTKSISDATLNKVLKLAGYAGRQTCHGFRHLFSTAMNERSSAYNISADWIESALAHKVAGIRGVYNHTTYFEERVTLMQLWADWVMPDRQRL